MSQEPIICHKPDRWVGDVTCLFEGAAEGIRREIERRAKAGEPIVIQRNGKIETIWPVNGEFPDDLDDDDLAEDRE